MESRRDERSDERRGDVIYLTIYVLEDFDAILSRPLKCVYICSVNKLIHLH